MSPDAKKAHRNMVENEVKKIEEPQYTAPRKNNYFIKDLEIERTKKMLNHLRVIIAEVETYGKYSTGWVTDYNLWSIKHKLPDSDIAGYLRGLGYSVFHKIRAREYDKTNGSSTDSDDSSYDSDEEPTYYQRKLRVTIN
jgi:hypothetical protein